MNDSIGRLLDSTNALLLDFDGPICGMFAGFSAPDVAAELRSFLEEKDVPIPVGLPGSDPLDFFRQFTIVRPDFRVAIENRLIECEHAAVRIARPTRGAHSLISAAARAHVPVAIVSNNSTDAIGDYLDQHGLAGRVTTVIGRPYGRPELMKPNPHTVLEAARALDAHPRESTFVGDSRSDIEAAQRAGTRSIGYAKAATRVSGLAEAGADAVVESIAELATRWDARR